MRTLISVVTCHKFRERADACRNTWVREVRGGADVRFFVGIDTRPIEEGNAYGYSTTLPVKENGDEVMLPCDDEYDGLAVKVKMMFAWAVAQGYQRIFKLDDDAFVVPQRLLSIGGTFDYVGNFRAANGKYPYDYASGFCYMLSDRAAKIVADRPYVPGDDTMEDRYVGNTLGPFEYNPLNFVDEKRFVCCFPGIDEATTLWSSPIGKSHAVYAQYPANKFADLHRWYKIIFQGVLC